MPNYWGKQSFSLGRFPEVGQKQKTERKMKNARKHAWRTQAAWAKRERLNDGNNNGQLQITNATSGGARKAAWATKNHIIIVS